MGDALIAEVATRLAGVATDVIRYQVNLVRGAENEVVTLANKLRTVTCVLDDADKKRFADKTTKHWLKRLEDTCSEMEDVLDEWDYALLQQQMEKSDAPKHKVYTCIPSLPSCLCFKKLSSRRNIALKIQVVKAKLDKILEEEKNFEFVKSQPIDPQDRSWRVPSTSFAKLVDISSRHRDQKILLNKILYDQGVSEGSEGELGMQVISIVGSGGIGKTSLAQLLYNDIRVQECYSLKIWLCVSHPFNTATIARGIIEKAKGRSPESKQLDFLLGLLKDSIQDQKFLLVLDDVWSENPDDWEPLKKCLEFGKIGSKLLVTTRRKEVAEMMGSVDNDSHHIGFLSDEDCWSILSHTARFASFNTSETEREKFKKIGMEIVSKCKGLPLAAKMLGGLLLHRSRRLEEWESIAKSEIWELERAKVELFPHLALSYDELPLALKRCFSYCAVFPKDHSIYVVDLIRNWLALGFLGSDESACELEFRGREYFNNLAMRSLFYEFKSHRKDDLVIVSCKMRDIVHDFVQLLRKDMSDGVVKPNCQVCSPSFVSHVKEYRTLHPFDFNESPPYICECQTSLRVLDLYSMEGIPRGLEKLIHLRTLSLFRVQKLTMEDLKVICKLYNLKNLTLNSCNLQEIPGEIGNLIRLRYLDLGWNQNIKELPMHACDLHELQSLGINGCTSLCELPQVIPRLTNLKHLHIEYVHSRGEHFPDVVGQLTGLHTLTGFRGKLQHLKKLNKLSGVLDLYVPKFRETENDVGEAKLADMKQKVHLRALSIRFQEDDCEENVEEKSVWIDVLEALEPHQDLYFLKISDYGGSKLPDWITSPLNQVRKISFSDLYELVCLPPFGKLPCLEILTLRRIHGLKFVGREFVGMWSTRGNMESSGSSSSSSTTTVAFPKLKVLTFVGCKKWKVWEDITVEEEGSTALSLFPCLTKLRILGSSLRALPHRILGKVPSLETLEIPSYHLFVRYHEDAKDSAWNFISHIPHVRFL